LETILNSATVALTGNLLETNGQQKGAINSVNYFISALYANPAASTVDYIQNIANNAGFPRVVRPTYAVGNEGFGFRGLNFVLPLWEAMRNIAYLLFAVIFIVVGLMIVLRVKIDPKTVVSIQNALPKIILSLILITFSYPIAGFLIDLMYVSIGLVLAIIQLTGLYNGPGGLNGFIAGLKTANFIQIMGNLGGAATGAGSSGLEKGVINPINTEFTQKVLGGLFTATGLTAGSGNITLFKTPLGDVNLPVADILSSVLGLYVAISVFVALLKTFLNLLTSYGTIIFSIILSPLILLGEAIPGRSSFFEWVKNLAANLLVFPLTILMIIFGIILLNQFTGLSTLENSFVPPLIGVPASAIGAFLGYIIIMTIPRAQDLLNEWLSVKVTKAATYWQESLPLRDTARKGWSNVTGALTRLIPI
jgi:hypothetical protein